MENLTTQSSLRSLDESGRPLTAGRPSYPETRETSFDGHLERARAETREEERVAEQRDARKEVSHRKERKAERSEDGRRSESTGQDERRVADGDDSQDEASAAARREAGEAAGDREGSEAQPEQDGADDQEPVIVAPVEVVLEDAPLELSGLAVAANEGAEGIPAENIGAGQASSPTPGGASGSIAQAAGAESGVRIASTALHGANPPEAAPAPESKTQVQAATKPEVETVRAPVDPERIARAESVLNQIRLRLGNDLRSATLALEPAELGRLKVQIEVESGSVRAELRVESAEALAALERHVPELRAMLSADGLELADVSIGLAPEGEFDQTAEDDLQRGGQAEQASDETEEALDASSTLTRALADEAGVDFLA